MGEEVREKEREGNGVGCFPEETLSWVFCLELLHLLHTLHKSLRVVFQLYFYLS